MTFAEVQFPTDISYGSQGGPEYSTSVIALQSGHEKRNANWSVARARYDVSFGIQSQTQMDNLIAFFRAMRGRATGFRYKDWADYQGVGEVIGTGDDSTTMFQLIKTYSSGSESIARSITKPVSGTVDVYIDSVLQVSGVSVDTTTGVVTFATPPASSEIISADFEFDVPVRFEDDYLETTLEKLHEHSVKRINLVEVRV